MGLARRMAGARRNRGGRVCRRLDARRRIVAAGAAIAVLWMASPAVARLISQSSNARSHLLVSEADAKALRGTARRTWRFFETFVTPLDNMLPPDNFQEDPRPEIAHRTSPTNLGLYLLSVVSARDFGWIGTDAGDRSARSTLRFHVPPAALAGAFLQLVRHALAHARSTLCTCRPWIAAIWPAISLRWRTRAGNGRPTRFQLSDVWIGITDALEITSAEAARLRAAGGHTQTVTLTTIRRCNRHGNGRAATGALSWRRYFLASSLLSPAKPKS